MRSHLHALRCACAACVLILLCACATQGPTMAPAQFLLVRPAALADDDPDDPALSPHGAAQAQALARRLARTPLVGIEVSQFRRTQQTAAPTAIQQRRSPARYYAHGDANEIARLWQQRYRHGQVLVIADIDMLGTLMEALCRCEVGPISDDAQQLYRVRPASAGPGQVSREPLAWH
jgi:phosphohistidine phosphatase SixA